MVRRIEMIRHGMPEGGSRFRGHGVDDPLSELGWQQMWQAVGERSDWQQILTSPLRRCAEFAAQLSQKQQIPLQIREPLKEIGFGSWEGKTRAELQRERAEEYANFYRNPVTATPAGAEPAEAFMQRVSAEFEQILQDYPEGDLLIVAHAGVIRAVMCHVLGASAASMYRLRIENAAILKLQCAQYIEIVALN